MTEQTPLPHMIEKGNCPLCNRERTLIRIKPNCTDELWACESCIGFRMLTMTPEGAKSFALLTIKGKGKK